MWTLQDEYFANTKEELTLRSYDKHIKQSEGPQVLTRQELEMKVR